MSGSAPGSAPAAFLPAPGGGRAEALVWAGAGTIALSLHLVLAGVGLEAWGARLARAAPAPVLQVELMAPELTRALAGPEAALGRLAASPAPADPLRPAARAAPLAPLDPVSAAERPVAARESAAPVAPAEAPEAVPATADRAARAAADGTLAPEGRNNERIAPEGRTGERLAPEGQNSERLAPEGQDSERVSPEGQNSERVSPEGGGAETLAAGTRDVRSLVPELRASESLAPESRAPESRAIEALAAQSRADPLRAAPGVSGAIRPGAVAAEPAVTPRAAPTPATLAPATLAPATPGLSPPRAAALPAAPSRPPEPVPPESAPPESARPAPVRSAAPSAVPAPGRLPERAALAATPPARAALAPAAPAPATLAPRPSAAPGAAPGAAPAPEPDPDPGPAGRAGIALPEGAPLPPAPDDSRTYEAVLDFLAGYAAGPCFVALPGLSDEGGFHFETFARDAAGLDAFRAALEARTGALPNTQMKPVSAAQCRALGFVQDSPAYPAFRLYFDLPGREIASGDRLEGRVGNTGAGFLSLLVIDDEGLVQDLGAFLRFTASGAVFSVPMTLTGAPGETRQLLMAISSPAGLSSLRDMGGSGPAEEVFSRIAAELRGAGAGEDIALIAFSVR